MKLTEKVIRDFCEKHKLIEEFLYIVAEKLNIRVKFILIQSVDVQEHGLSIIYEIKSIAEDSRELEYTEWSIIIPYKKGTKELISPEEYIKTFKLSEYTVKLASDIALMESFKKRAESELEDATKEVKDKMRTFKKMSDNLASLQKEFQELKA